MGPSGPPGQGCETNCPSAGCGSGSLVFPASSMTLGRHRPGLRGIPGACAAYADRSRCSRKPSWTSLPSRALECDGVGSRRPSSRGIRRYVPSRRHACRASTPGGRSPHRCDGCHPSHRVPSSWFLPTSTVSSARRSRVCCTPQPDKGSSRFAYTGARRPEAARMRARTRVIRSVAPRDAVHTLRSLPFIDSRTASPRPLPSLPLPSRRSGSTIRIGEAPVRRSGPPRHRMIIASSSASRPCSVDEVRCRRATVASGRRSFLPWALFLFEVQRVPRGPAVPCWRILRGRSATGAANRTTEGRTRGRRKHPKAAKSGGSPASLPCLACANESRRPPESLCGNGVVRIATEAARPHRPP